MWQCVQGGQWIGVRQSGRLIEGSDSLELLKPFLLPQLFFHVSANQCRNHKRDSRCRMNMDIYWSHIHTVTSDFWWRAEKWSETFSSQCLLGKISKGETTLLWVKGHDGEIKQSTTCSSSSMWYQSTQPSVCAPSGGVLTATSCFSLLQIIVTWRIWFLNNYSNQSKVKMFA